MLAFNNAFTNVMWAKPMYPLMPIVREMIMITKAIKELLISRL
jgi:hypothetical protein